MIGEGWHRRHGELHAEREALADAERRGNDPAGATIFVTLEPCAHTGSQPPCADGLIEAGVGEVVIAAGDPTERPGRWPGPARRRRDPGPLGRRAGCRRGARPDSGLSQAGPDRQTPGYLEDGDEPRRQGRDPDRGLKWISGEESRALVHRWRAEMDAVAVGSGTLTADDLRLTARHTDGEPVRQPARVIFDSGLLITTGAALFADIDEAPLLIIAGPRPDPDRLAALKRPEPK